ncbi:MAG: nucleotidyl transferase AbiEii/AbiGii toxin family protein [candidate division WOR-3 bacterium]|nr:nucleotidyl transferase AbiEii/AbiGii toxin family protein [candidate division WOR-3 bacterium]
MLTREELFVQAESRNLPLGKERGILREYLHYLILDNLNILTDKLLFTGGTALRLIYNFSRFSFDLDFDATKLAPKTFQNILDRLVAKITKLGFEIKLGRTKSRGNILTAELNFPEIFARYGIRAPEEKMMVRIEILNVSPARLKSEVKLVRNFDGSTIIINVLRQDLLSAEKFAAFFERERERDFYDAFFIIFNQFPVDLKLLNKLLSPKFHFSDYPELKRKVKEKMSNSDLSKIGRKLEPFLLDSRHLEIIAKPQFYL